MHLFSLIICKDQKLQTGLCQFWLMVFHKVKRLVHVIVTHRWYWVRGFALKVAPSAGQIKPHVFVDSLNCYQSGTLDMSALRECIT